MERGPVPLERHFSLVPKPEAGSDGQEFHSIWRDRKRTSWQELEEEFRCVILAEAGAGKSFEMETRAKCVEASGRAAFFIRIEDIEDGFETAFEVGRVDAFESWRGSLGDAWFFLDSVDEARLENPRAFEKAIKRFAARLGSANRRAHVFISSRPYAWRAHSDRALLERYLPLGVPRAEEAENMGQSPEKIGVAVSAEPESALRVYFLEPLDEDDIRTFADHRETPQVDRLIVDVQRANLMSMAARPFDLEGILAKWEADRELGGRLELLQHSIGLRLREIDPDRAQRQPLNVEKARRGARLLAAAVVLTGESGIRVPDLTQADGGIDAETVLGDWVPSEVQALLERGIFNDALYGVVRFRHREVSELLAAEWFRDQLRDGHSRYATESLFVREQYGRLIITPRLRPVLSWLILFDDAMRHRVLGIAPEISVEGGDAARLPLAERQALLADIVRRIVVGEDDRSVRDNSAIARIAQPDLAGDVLRLIADYRDNNDAIFFLGRLVWQGEMTACVPALSEIAVDPERGIYAHIAATRAVMTCGARAQRDHLWAELVASPALLPRKLLAEVLEDTAPDLVSVNFLLVSIGKLEAYEPYGSTGLSQAIHGFVDRLPIGSVTAASELLWVLVSGLNGYLGREPYIERRECHVSEAFAWLLGPATHAAERLASARSKAALSSEVLSVMLKTPAVQFWRGENFDEYKHHLHEIVPIWRDLNDMLFWRSVEEARAKLAAEKAERLTDDWTVQWLEHYWNFGTDRFDDVLGFIVKRDFLDDKMVSLSLAYRLFVQADEPDGWLRKLKGAVEGNSDLEGHLDARLNLVKSQSVVESEARMARLGEERKREQEERDQGRAEWLQYLMAMPDVVRHPPGLEPDEISMDQYWLLLEIEGSGLRTRRDGGADWEALIPEFGEDVARAYRDAAVSHWRRFTPGLRSEGHDTNSIPYALIFAMAGLEIEAGEADFFRSLTEAEVLHVLRYLVWELSGLPEWLEPLHQVYPKPVLDAVLAELYWELEHTGADQPTHYILHNLVYCAPWLHRDLAPMIAAWMERNDVLNSDSLSHCIHIMLSGDADREVVSELAQSKIAKNAVKAQLAIWYALWVDLDADEAIPATEKWLSSLPEEHASSEAQLLITKLMGTRRPFNNWPVRGSFQTARHLRSLYMLMHRHIRTEDDIDRSGKGVYSPGLRDDAQDGRDALVKQLSELPGKETYMALTRLARDHPDARYRPWMERLACKRAEEDANLEPWSAQQVRDYDHHHTRTPRTNRQLFDVTVERLIDLKAWIERGSDSPYRTWQRADGETEMRNLVAGQLNARSSGRYTCAQENEFPNGQRPDIWVQNACVPSSVPIELKLLDKEWSGPELCERLRNQLAGDYLREETAGCGVMLLVWQGRSKRTRWQIEGRRVALSGLGGALRLYWGTVADDFPGVVTIEVIVIDLTVRAAKSKD